MSCSGAYASSWQFASFWCLAGYLEGVHGGAGPADAALSDTQVDFLDEGAEANVGQILYNVTDGTSGPITACTATALTATTVTWNALDAYRFSSIDASEISRINMNLELAAGNIHAARAATKGCDCTLAGWAADELAKINVILSGALYACRCASPHLNDTEQKRSMLEFAEGKLEMIRDGRIELCAGYGAKDFPAWGVIEKSTTPFAAAEIILHRWQRGL